MLKARARQFEAVKHNLAAPRHGFAFHRTRRLKAELLQNPARGRIVLHMAGDHESDIGIGEYPAKDAARALRGVTLAPIGFADDVADLDGIAVGPEAGDAEAIAIGLARHGK